MAPLGKIQADLSKEPPTIASKGQHNTAPGKLHNRIRSGASRSCENGRRRDPSIRKCEMPCCKHERWGVLARVQGSTEPTLYRRVASLTGDQARLTDLTTPKPVSTSSINCSLSSIGYPRVHAYPSVRYISHHIYRKEKHPLGVGLCQQTPTQHTTNIPIFRELVQETPGPRTPRSLPMRRNT